MRKTTRGLSATTTLTARFNAAHRRAMSAIKRRDFRALQAAIDQERGMIEKQQKLIKMFQAAVRDTSKRTRN